MPDFGSNKFNTNLKLGTQVNIFKGIKWRWDTASGNDSPFYFPDQPFHFPDLPFQSTPPKLDSFAAHRSFTQLRVSLHYTWRDLVEGLYNRWHIMDQSNNSSAFVLGGSETGITDQLCAKLNIRAEDAREGAQVGFALVTLTKSLANWNFISLGIDKQVVFRELNNKLATLPEDTVKVDEFLAFFKNYGTHYVSSLEIGDVLYQVFVYERAELKKIAENFGGNTFEDSYAECFQVCVPLSKYAGAINLMSDNPYLANLLPKCVDEGNRGAKNIFIAMKLIDNEEFYGHFMTIVPIGCCLTNMGELITDKKRVDAWSGVFQRVLYQKYEKNINPNFPPAISGINYKQIYQSFQSPWVTNFATSYITLNQIRLQLDETKTLNPDKVKQLFIFADVVELAADINLPGESVIIICHKFISYQQTSSAPTIFLTEEGYANFRLYYQEFNGAAMIKNSKTNEHQLIYLGQTYQSVKTSDQESTVIYVAEKDRNLPPLIDSLRLLGDKTLYTLGMPLQTVQSILNHPAGDDPLTVARRFTQWLADILAPATDKDPDLVYLRFQALLLLKSNLSNPANILNVPILTYDAYREDIEGLMAAVDAFTKALADNQTAIAINMEYERTHHDLEHINENIQKTGKFLAGMNTTMAAKEGDILNFYDRVNQKQQTKYNAAKQLVGDLKKELDGQQTKIIKAYDDLRTGIHNYVMNESINAAMDIALALAGAVAGVGGISSISKISETCKKVLKAAEAAMKLIETISRVCDFASSVENIDKKKQEIDTSNKIDASKVLKDLPPEADLDVLSILSEKDWEEYDADVYAEMSPIAGEIPEAYAYMKEAKILSIKKKAYINAASQVAKIDYDMLLNGWQKDIARRQADRLTELNKTLNQPELPPLEAEKIDLYELSSIYQSHSQQVTLQLVKALSLQDAALRYYYFQDPTAIKSYDILSLKEVIVSQKDKAVAALENFPSRPSELLEPYVYTLKGVKVSELSDDRDSINQVKVSLDEYRRYSRGGYQFDIPLDAPDLFNYVRVRILEIQMKVDGIESTNSGKLNVRLVTDAHPFYDRGLNRDEVQYNTIQQVFENVWDLQTGRCIYSNRTAPEFAKDYMKMTPFTKWRISLPTGKNNENAGIKFKSDTVDITLSFYVQAIRLSAPELNALLAQKAQGA